MKKLFTLLVILALTISVFAQVPQKISYQAVIRNSSGQLVASHAVGMRISILEGSATGTPVYVETHKPTTNVNGLATIEIGGGTIVSGTFSATNWAAGAYFLKTETDPAGGSSYTIVGTSQLLSVPYALYSKTSGDLADNSVTSAKIVDGTVSSVDIANNAVNSSKIQDGSVVTADLANHTVSTDKLGNLAVSTEKIQNTSVTADKLSSMGATSGQVLRWNGIAWEPATSGLSLPFTGSGSTGPYGIHIEHTNNEQVNFAGEFYNHSDYSGSAGVYGVGTNEINYTYGGKFESYSIRGTGILAIAAADSGRTNGGNFISRSTEGYGVYGQATAASGPTYGGYFRCVSTSGRGVYGITSATSGYTHGGSFESQSTSGIGVFGQATATSGYTHGGSFASESPSGVGVFGYASATDGSTYGGYFQCASSKGTAVKGYVPALSGNTHGGEFESKSTSGTGVLGKASASSGTTYGGYFINTSTEGNGVYGVANATSGTTYGGFFESKSTSGYGVIGHSQKFAVYGKSSGAQGRAVTGEATGTMSIGVRGIALSDNSTGVWGEGANYDFYANGPGTNYGSSSSVRWKENIEAIANPLEMIKKLRGVYFDWNAEHGGLHDIGFIAEEVGKILPEIVVYEENGIDASGLDYSKITPLLLEAIKEQQKQIDELKTIVNQLVSNLFEPKKPDQ